MSAGTVLVTETVPNCLAASEVFGTLIGNRLPIRIIPQSSGFPYVQIPHGTVGIMTRRGAYVKELMKPGFHWMGPFERVAYLMPVGYQFYDTPIKACPSADNVSVSIDIFLTFRIVDHFKFLETLVPEKLGQLLTASQDEAVRNLARATKHDRIYDLVTYEESEIVRDMNKRFINYGVEIHDVMITDVRLPQGMANSLESETTYKTKQRLQEKIQSFDLRVQQDSETIKEIQAQRSNEAMAVTEEAKKVRSMIAKEISELQAHTQKRVAEINAGMEAQVAQIRAQADLVSGKLDREKESVLLSAAAQANAECERVKAETLAYMEEKRSAAAFVSSQLKSKALGMEAEAEAKASKKMAAKRAVDAEARKVNVLRALGANTQTLISGSCGGNQSAAMLSAELSKAIM